jgi:hypothetical protein
MDNHNQIEQLIVAMTPEEVANKTAMEILNTLEGQRFADWYNTGKFDHFIRDDLPTITQEEIIKDIKRLFRLTPQ